MSKYLSIYLQSYHGDSYLRRFGHHGESYLDSPGHRLESQTEKLTKRIKNEGPSVLPDSAQGPPEDSNPIPHSLGLGLGPLPYWCCWLLDKPPRYVHSREPYISANCTWNFRDTICMKVRGTTVAIYLAWVVGGKSCDRSGKYVDTLLIPSSISGRANFSTYLVFTYL